MQPPAPLDFILLNLEASLAYFSSNAITPQYFLFWQNLEYKLVTVGRDAMLGKSGFVKSSSGTLIIINDSYILSVKNI